MSVSHWIEWVNDPFYEWFYLEGFPIILSRRLHRSRSCSHYRSSSHLHMYSTPALVSRPRLAPEWSAVLWCDIEMGSFGRSSSDVYGHDPARRRQRVTTKTAHSRVSTAHCCRLTVPGPATHSATRQSQSQRICDVSRDNCHLMIPSNLYQSVIFNNSTVKSA